MIPLRYVFAAMAVVIVLAAGCGGSKPACKTAKPEADPFVLKQGTIRGEQYRLVRAVAGGRLYVLYFVHHKGVWFLIGSKQAATLSPGSMSNPKGPAS